MTLAILTEASLSFLGLGVQPPDPTWGGMIAESTSVMALARGWPSARDLPSCSSSLASISWAMACAMRWIREADPCSTN